MSFYRNQQIKAVRKQRQCTWCGEMILKGEPANYYATTYEGEFQDGYLHPECGPPCATYCRKYDEYTLGEGQRGKPELKEECQ